MHNKIYIIISLILIQVLVSGCPHLAYYAMKSLDKQYDEMEQNYNMQFDSLGAYYIPTYLSQPNRNKEINIATMFENDSAFLANYNEFYESNNEEVEIIPIADTSKITNIISDTTTNIAPTNNAELVLSNEKLKDGWNYNHNKTDSTTTISLTFGFGSKQSEESSSSVFLPDISFEKQKKIKSEAINLDILSINSNNYPDSIIINAKIYDYSGKYISGIAPPYNTNKNWRQYWKMPIDSSKCKIEEITDFSVKEIKSDVSPAYAFSFVLDHSPSMTNKVAYKLQKSVYELFDMVKDEDWISVIKFSGKVFLEIPPTSDSSVYNNEFIMDSLGNGRYKGKTAIYDALNTAIDELSVLPDSLERIIILLSDGKDNASKSKLDEVMLKARKHNCKIYTIAYLYAEKQTMKRIAKYTNGRFYYLFSSDEFPYVFKDIYSSLTNYYQITYTPPKCETIHKAKIAIKLPIGQGVSAEDSVYYDCSFFKDIIPIGTIVFANIEFKTGSAEINENSLLLLDKIADELLEKSNLKLEITGHTDDIGNEEDNLILSSSRAKSVKEYLISKGIDEKRLRIVGYGESKPLFSNDNKENRQKNRRTEFIVVGN